MSFSLRPLHLACGDEGNATLVRIVDGKALATNGNMIAVTDLRETSSMTPEMIEKLSGRFIHKEVWKHIHKCEGIEIYDDYIVCHTDIKSVFYFSEPDGEFFDLVEILDSVKSAGEQGKRNLRLRPADLQVAGKILGDNELYISITKGNNNCVLFNAISGTFVILNIPGADGVNRYMFTV